LFGGKARKTAASLALCELLCVAVDGQKLGWGSFASQIAECLKMLQSDRLLNAETLPKAAKVKHSSNW